MTIETRFGDEDANGRQVRSDLQLAGLIALLIAAGRHRNPTPFSAQPAGRDQFAEQRSRPVVVIAEVAMQHFQNGQTDVEPDQVGQLPAVPSGAPFPVSSPRRSHRVRRRLPESKDRLVDHWHQDAVDTKPGKSLTTTGVLPSRRANDSPVSAVSSESRNPRTTSTRGNTGTGLKKCMPMTRSGRFEDCRQRGDRERRGVGGKQRLLAERGRNGAEDFSLDVRVLEDRLDDDVGDQHGGILRRGRDSSQGNSAASGSILPRCAARSKLLRIDATARSASAPVRSTRTTGRPACATTWAIPLPIVPPPITATTEMPSSARSLKVRLPQAGFVTTSEGSASARRLTSFIAAITPCLAHSWTPQRRARITSGNAFSSSGEKRESTREEAEPGPRPIPILRRVDVLRPEFAR